MAFTATVTTTRWKSQPCVGCGGSYQYKITRKGTGGGDSEGEAAANAKRNVGTKIRDGSDIRPCPHCGCVQPAMIANAKAWVHLLVVGVLVIPYILLFFMAMRGTATWMQYSRAAFILAGLSALGLLVHAATALWNPNRNLRANRGRADRLIARGLLREGKAADDDARGRKPSATGPGTPLWLAVAGAGWLLLLSPLIGKIVGGWASNAEVKPDVAGPGDTVRVFFDTQIKAVNSQWRGTPRAVAVINGKAYQLPATASTRSWGTSLKVKGSSYDTPVLWADVVLPRDSTLAGETLAIYVEMDVEYPTPGGGVNTFVEGRAKAVTALKLRLSSAGAGSAYWYAFLFCVLGCVVFTVAGVGLSVSADGLKKRTDDARPLKRAGRRPHADEDDEDDSDEAPSREDAAPAPRPRPRGGDPGDWRK